MTSQANERNDAVMILDGKTAAELMSPRVLTVRDRCKIAEAVTLLVAKNLHALPVTDDDGAPIGVLSRSDIVAHAARGDLGERCVRQVMTPVIHAVTPQTSAGAVVHKMIGLGVHRLFVIATDGSLLGVISSLDVLRHMHAPLLVAFEQVELLCANEREFNDAVQALRSSSGSDDLQGGTGQ